MPRALAKCCLNFPGNSRCYIEFGLQSVYEEPMIRVVHHESGSTSFPKTLMPAYQPPHSQVNTRCEIWWNETVCLSTDNGQFKEFARATKHPVGTTSTSGRRVAHKKCYLSNGRKSHQSNSYDREISEPRTHKRKHACMIKSIIQFHQDKIKPLFNYHLISDKTSLGSFTNRLRSVESIRMIGFMEAQWAMNKETW